MAAKKESVTYSEDPDVLSWIEQTRAAVAAHRGSDVTRTDVIRWATRRARGYCRDYGDDAIEIIAAQV